MSWEFMELLRGFLSYYVGKGLPAATAWLWKQLLGQVKRMTMWYHDTRVFCPKSVRKRLRTERHRLSDFIHPGHIHIDVLLEEKSGTLTQYYCDFHIEIVNASLTDPIYFGEGPIPGSICFEWFDFQQNDRLVRENLNIASEIKRELKIGSGQKGVLVIRQRLSQDQWNRCKAIESTPRFDLTSLNIKTNWKFPLHLPYTACISIPPRTRIDNLTADLRDSIPRITARPAGPG